MSPYPVDKIHANHFHIAHNALSGKEAGHFKDFGNSACQRTRKTFTSKNQVHGRQCRRIGRAVEPGSGKILRQT
jgi:hypothetical protein